MGTRISYGVEKKDSRIKWELADSSIRPKLDSAINKYNYSKLFRFLCFIPAVIFLLLLFAFLYLLKENYEQYGISVHLIFFLIYGLGLISFVIFSIIKYKNFRPYLYPEKQDAIWIFTSQCYEIYESGLPGGDSKVRYHACFNKGGIHIRIFINGAEFRSNPVGKDYIFYKFNSNTGYQWKAIPLDMVK